MRLLGTIIATLLAASFCFAQNGGNLGGNTGGEQEQDDKRTELLKQQRVSIDQAEKAGIEVRIKDIARFRGHRVNMLQGYGIVVGLDGTGDSQQTPFTATLLANALEQWGTIIDETKFKPKNVMAVSIIAELPAFSAPGNMIDITVSSIGDGKSLQGGTLLLAPLYGPTDNKSVIAVAQGSISIGGFNASSGGTSARKNHSNVGRIPSGAIVEQGVSTQLIFDGNKIFLELYMPDITTSNRVATALADKFPEFFVTPVDGGSIQITIPDGFNAMLAMSQIEQATVFADVPAVIIVNERTGTIVIGGNVKIGPAVIAHGSLQVRIDAIPFVVPAVPLNPNPALIGEENIVTAQEDPTQISVIPPSTTISDLARILQTLEVSARDIIAILQALSQSGALKARIKIQ